MPLLKEQTFQSIYQFNSILICHTLFHLSTQLLSTCSLPNPPLFFSKISVTKTCCPPLHFRSSMQLHPSPSFAPPNSCYSDHTTQRYLPMHSHVAVLERLPPQKLGWLIKTQIKPQNLMCSHWGGDLLLGHTSTIVSI
jgi:hypothetical protein